MSVGLIMGNVRAIGMISVTIDPASIDANTTAEQDVTVAGLKVGDFVCVSKPTATAGVGIVNARVKADNTLALTLVNATAAPVDAASETWTVLVLRPEGSLPSVPSL